MGDVTSGKNEKAKVKPNAKPKEKSKPAPEPKPALPSHTEQLLKSLLDLIAQQNENLTLEDFASDWLIELAIKFKPEGEEIIVSLIKDIIANENHDGLCTILDSLNEDGDWLDGTTPTHRKEILDILTGVIQRFWENKGLVTTVSNTFAQVPNEAIDAMREAELDNDSFDEIVKKMFVYVQDNC